MKEIKCPSCGAAQATWLGGLKFECDYCHTNFFVIETISDEDMGELKSALGDLAKAGRELVSTFHVVPVEEKPPKPAPTKRFSIGEFIGGWVFTIIFGLILDVVFGGTGVCFGIFFILAPFVGWSMATDNKRKK